MNFINAVIYDDFAHPHFYNLIFLEANYFNKMAKGDVDISKCRDAEKYYPVI